jgi:thiol-disulfide isomerase/thioredoxin
MYKLIFALFTLSCVALSAQDARTLPSIEVKDLKGSAFNTANLSNNGKPIVISFWATWCSPCKRELNNIAEVYPDWQEETGVKLVAISIDDARNAQKVKPYVNGQSWDYEVYIDQNSDFKRAMGVSNVPHTFLIDGSGRIVWQHNSYAEGDENELYKQIKLLASGKKVD